LFPVFGVACSFSAWSISDDLFLCIISGKTLYLSGIRVFTHSDGRIVLAYQKANAKQKKGICYIQKGSDADKFFRIMLKGKIPNNPSS